LNRKKWKGYLDSRDRGLKQNKKKEEENFEQEN